MAGLDRDQVLEDLMRDEGWKPHAYQDHLGFWTIGYGFLIDERRGGELPKWVADLWLGYRVRRLEAELDRRIPWWTGQPEEVRRALVNMAYQLGVSGLLNFRRMLAALQRGDRYEAAIEALDSRWSRQTPARAQRIAKLIGGSDD